VAIASAANRFKGAARFAQALAPIIASPIQTIADISHPLLLTDSVAVIAHYMKILTVSARNFATGAAARAQLPIMTSPSQMSPIAGISHLQF